MADDTRDTMVEGAIRLLATRGVHGASLGQVLEYTGAPRGSVYHHFPGGKNQLLSEALDVTGRRHDEAVAAHAGSTAQSVVASFFAFWRGVLVGSDYESGCPVLAVTVSAPDGALFDKAGSVFAASLDRLAELLAGTGVGREEAAGFATVLVASAEGAVVLGRLQRSTRPVDLVERQLMEHAKVLDERAA